MPDPTSLERNPTYFNPLAWATALLVGMGVAVSFASDASIEEFRLVWSDEFEKDGVPDPENWTSELGFKRNRELQWYQAENATCQDGLLVIEGRRETRPNPLYRNGAGDWKERRKNILYTSSCLTTKGLHAWKYGRFEVRARIKCEAGLWPAIWFLGVDGQWPSNGEIDLMEYYDGEILANACWGGSERGRVKWDSSRKPFDSFTDPGWDRKFHIWRMDWDSESIRLFVDDVLLNTIDLTKTNNTTDRGPLNPFQQPHFLLLNLAIGGTKGGDPSKTRFPSRYEIDYVRVYEKK